MKTDTKNLSKKEKEQMYKDGYIFIRTRKRELTHKQEMFDTPQYGLFQSHSFGSWKLNRWFHTEEEMMRDVEEILMNNDNVIQLP